MNTILIVDDENINLMLLEKALEKAGFETLKAKDGKEALNLFRNNKCDLIITDYQMPEMNGVEFIKKIKEIDGDTPIFIQTAYDEEYIEEDGKLEDEFIKKPIDFNVLRILLNRYI